MVFERIRRTAAWAGLAGALALVAPVGAASARTHGQAEPLTVIPQLASVAPAPQSSTEVSQERLIKVAQTPEQIRRRREARRRQQARQRQARRNQAARQRQANRNQASRQRQASRRQAQRQRRIYRNGQWYTYRGDGYYNNSGAALAAGAIGLAAGAIAGSALASQPRVVYEEPRRRGVPTPYTAEWYRQCDVKYNSFRASDGTYLGYDGVRHTCRLP